MKKVRVKFVSKEVGKFDCAIVIIPRGGQKKLIETSITVIEPKLIFSP